MTYEQPYVEKALNALDAFTIKMKSGVDETVITNLPDRFHSMPKEYGTPGTKIMRISDDDSDSIVNIVKIPKGGAVKPHFHTDILETVTGILGCVNFKVYASDEYSEIINEGKIYVGDELVIEPAHVHYIFTSKESAVLKVEFKKVI